MMAVVAIIVAGLILVLAVLIYIGVRRRQRRNTFTISTRERDAFKDNPYMKWKDDRNWKGEAGFLQASNEKEARLIENETALYHKASKKTVLYLRNTNQSRVAKDLPLIGARRTLKFFSLISDDVKSKELEVQELILVQYDGSKLPPFNPNAGLGEGRLLQFEDPESFRAFKLALVTMRHPNIIKSFDVGISKDSTQIFVYRELGPKGSLRDLLHVQKLNLPYREKYGAKGKPFEIGKIRRYGRQILEGLLFLENIGIPYLHLHTGNIIMNDQGDCMLTDIESGFLGLEPPERYIDYIRNVRQFISRPAAPIILLFGYVLYECSMAHQCQVANPLDTIIKLKRKPPKPIIHLLGKIFGDQSIGVEAPTVKSLLNEPFFRGAEVLRSDYGMSYTESYTKLRAENAQVDAFSINGSIPVDKWTESIKQRGMSTTKTSSIPASRTSNIRDELLRKMSNKSEHMVDF